MCARKLIQIIQVGWTPTFVLICDRKDMTNIRVFLGVTAVIIQTVLVTATPLRIGAFNLHVFGATKAAEPSTLSIYSRVSM